MAIGAGNRESLRPVDTSEEFSRFVRSGGFDHLDFGCGTGDSLEVCRKVFGGRLGLGIDRSAAKVEAARAAGFAAVVFDIHDIPEEALVRFTALSHFLEHVPDPGDVRAFVRKACTVSSDFVYIQQPFFDADGYLAGKGLKLYWSDWRGHPNRMTSLELWIVLRDLRAAGLPIEFSIHHRGRIGGSGDARVHPLDSPVDQHHYDAGIHGAKPREEFDRGVYAETLCLITMPPANHDRLLGRIGFDRTVLPGRGRERGRLRRRLARIVRPGNPER